MDLEKLASRARSTLAVISFIGLLILALGVLLTLTVISHATAASTGDWVSGHYSVGGPMALMAAGLLTAVIPWAIYPMTNLMFRRAIEMRYQNEQFLNALDAQRTQLEKIRDITALSDAAKQV